MKSVFSQDDTILQYMFICIGTIANKYMCMYVVISLVANHHMHPIVQPTQVRN